MCPASVQRAITKPLDPRYITINLGVSQPVTQCLGFLDLVESFWDKKAWRFQKLSESVPVV